jgi:hypothetical protein
LLIRGSKISRRASARRFWICSCGAMIEAGSLDFWR